MADYASMVRQLQERIRSAAAARTPLAICGGGTKHFYGGAPVGEPLAIRDYAGMVDYEPKELVLTVRAGTPLAEIERVLQSEGQMLPFEPPHFGPGATIGGTVACGFAGPRRAYAGSVRDFMLGVRLLDGNGQDLSFGGRVIKNVAGYDVTRLMAGALGTLGALLEISFKVLPQPVAETTLCFAMLEAAAIEAMNLWAGQPLPLSATAWFDGTLHVRLSGTAAGVAAAERRLGGDRVSDGATFWRGLREQTLPFFADASTLWRVALPATTPPANIRMPQCIEWGGAQRWLRGPCDVAELREAMQKLGGHVTQFRGDRQQVFHPLAPQMAALHQRLKFTFDPHGILNAGRMDNL